MLISSGYDPRYASMLRDYGHVPTLNEQAARDMLHPKTYHRLARAFNAFVGWLLCSPLHRLVSGSVMLITFRGRKSGDVITTPVNYLVQRRGALQVLSRRDHHWWRNLTGGENVMVRVRGQEHHAFCTVITDPQRMESELQNLLVRMPGYGKGLEIRRTAEGDLRRDDLERAAQSFVMVCIRLD